MRRVQYEQKTAVVLFGGQSSEHVVSCMSVVNVINHINREKYDLLLIGITEERTLDQNRFLRGHRIRGVEGRYGGCRDFS